MWKTPMYDTTKLTVELRKLVEYGVDIWDFYYPSYYQGEKKKEFEQKFIDHFYFRQIGQETVGRFLHMFRARVRELMPYYIELYKTVEIMAGIEDPFGNVDITETYEEERSDSGNASSSSNGTTSTTSSSGNQHIFSNTPQGEIQNLETHMTEAAKDTATNESNMSADNTGSSSHESTGTVKHTLKRKGNQGVNTYAHDMIEFRQSILNLDMQLINEFNDLFLGIY